MIKFDPAELSYEVVLLKNITQALGGSIQIVDEEKTIGDKEVYQRVPVPLSVARAFIMKHQKVTKYLKPVLTAIVKYGDRVIAMERHPMGGMGERVSIGLDGEPVMWTPYSQSNLDRFVLPTLYNSNRDWFFDGRYVYSFTNNDIEEVLHSGVSVTNDNKFRKVIATSIDLQELANADKLQPQERSCLAYVSDLGDIAISPPIWKDLESLGQTKMADDEASLVNLQSFDKIDEKMSVNLNFALKAGNEIGKMFGYEMVEPLQLPRLMIELHTVNLPNIPKQVKATYDIGLQFTHALAWLLGMSRKAQTLDTYVMMRSLMKYLTKKGIFHNSTFQASSVFQSEQTIENVPLLSLDELMDDDNFTKQTLSAIMSQATTRKRRSPRDVSQVGGLLTEV